VTTFEKLWPKFKRGKRYREAFVAQHAKQEIGFQIRALLKQYNLTQAVLAKRAGLTQGVVSRAADPSYGNLTINTLVRIAAGFDVAFVGRFVPFGELPKWFDRLEIEPFAVPSFDEEDAARDEQEREHAQLSAAIEAVASAAAALSPSIIAAFTSYMEEARGGILSMLQPSVTGQQGDSLMPSVDIQQQSQPSSNLVRVNFGQRAAQREAAHGLGGQVPR
jgi:transcriptional regulator with XRE-family HTH domain